MNRIHLYSLTLALCLIGFGLSFYKVMVLRFPVVPDTTSSLWTVDATVQFRSKGKPVKVSLNIPRSDRTTAVMDENFISRGFGLTTTERTLNRKAVWSKRNSKGQQNLFYRAIIRKLEAEEENYALPPAKRTKPRFEGAYLAATEALIELIGSKSADTETFVRNLLVTLKRSDTDENVRLLLGKKPSPEKEVVVAARILNIGNIPARAAHGIRLTDQLRDAPIEHWVEVYDNHRWRMYGRQESRIESPEEFLIWWRGETELSDIVGGNHLQIRLAVSRNQEEAIHSAIIRSGIVNPSLLEYSLFSLPIQTQAVYRVLLLIPIGALLIVLLRNVVGIKTFGTFMPILIAIAFRETQLVSGLILFTLLVALGLSVRFYLEKLKLLVVPRLASTLAVVVIIMALLSVITHKLGIGYGLSLALFPTVILTMTIEKMSIIWEEVGPAQALTQGLGTLIAVSITYPILINRFIEHAIFIFPELLLVILALLILMGRYTGFRLLELHRFRELARKDSE